MPILGFGTRLRTFRENLRLSQAEIAEKVVISQAGWWQAENGRHHLALDNLVTLHDLYGLNLNWLLTGMGPMRVSEKGPWGPNALALEWDVDGPISLETGLQEQVSDAFRLYREASEVLLDDDQVTDILVLLSKMAMGLGRPVNDGVLRALLRISRGPNAAMMEAKRAFLEQRRAAEAQAPYGPGAGEKKKEG